MRKRKGARKKRIIGYQGTGTASVISPTYAGVRATSRRAMKASQKSGKGGKISAAFIGIKDKNIKPIMSK